MAPVTLRLGVNLRVAVYLARGGKQYSCPDPFSDSEHIESTIGARLDGFYWVVLENKVARSQSFRHKEA